MEKPGNINAPVAVPFQDYPKNLGWITVNNPEEERAARAVEAKRAPVAPPSKSDLELSKLKSFLMENFKNETGDETPVDCAIRLLGKAKKK